MASLALAAMLLFLVLTCSGTQAAGNPEDPTTHRTPSFSVGGFGTFGVVHSSERDADFTAISSQATGAGGTHDWSAAPDSRVGVQASADITSRLSAVLQVIAEQNFDNDYAPHVEWANIKYQATPDFGVRLGRTELPVFLAADTRAIDYANPWVRPPLEIYTLVPVSSNDGIDVSYRSRIGSMISTYEITLGQLTARFPGYVAEGSTHTRGRKQRVLVDTIDWGFSTLRVSYGQSRFSISEFGPLFDAFREFGPQGVGIAERYDVNDRVVTYMGVGARYDPGRWFAMSEWGRVNGHSAVGERTGWYVSGGYRVGKVTPYATYARLRKNSPTSDPGLNTADLPAPLAAVAAGLNDHLNSALAPGGDQQTVSLGGRWDFMQSLALKVQYDHMRLGENSQGTLINLRPGFQRGSALNIFSITLDFVF